MFVDGTSGSGWWYEGAGIYRHVYLVATDMLHIDQNGLGSYANVTGKIAHRNMPALGHSADATVTVRLTVVNQGTSTAKGVARATLRDVSGAFPSLPVALANVETLKSRLVSQLE